MNIKRKKCECFMVDSRYPTFVGNDSLLYCITITGATNHELHINKQRNDYAIELSNKEKNIPLGSEAYSFDLPMMSMGSKVQPKIQSIERNN